MNVLLTEQNLNLYWERVSLLRKTQVARLMRMNWHRKERLSTPG